MKTRIIFFTCFINFFYLSNAFSCTAFTIIDNNQIVYGRNFDFEIESGFIVNNIKGKEKYAYLSNKKNVMRWRSKYGSVTFNQAGMEFPYSGMNEKGLVIAQLYLSETKYPDTDNRKEISNLQWIQYQLDVSATIDEIIESDSIIRISNEFPVGIHFFVCDKSGRSATIEFINGKMICHFDSNLPVPLLTNNTYEESYSYLKQFEGFGGKRQLLWNNIYDFKWTDNNTDNINKVFATAAKKLTENSNKLNLVDRAFDVLESVTIENHTQWSTVFDITNMKIYFKNNQRNEVIKLDFNDFSFNSEAQIKLLDIQSVNAKNIKEQFIAYSSEKNKEYILNLN